MAFLFSDLLTVSATRTPNALALKAGANQCQYGELDAAVDLCAQWLLELGVQRQARVAIFLPKQLETVIALFGTSRAGAVFVPINPALKALQVQHILRDCNVCVLITSAERLETLRTVLEECHELQHIVLLNAPAALPKAQESTPLKRVLHLHDWNAMLGSPIKRNTHRVIDTDMAAILYTSGSTGQPKGVVLSHRNLLSGAHSVAQYLKNTADDRLLAVLPLSFDYGLSQISTAFYAGARVVLLDHLFTRDVLDTLSKEQITGLAAVPPLWSQLAELSWPKTATESLRYITNSGGSMPIAVLEKLRTALPRTQVFLMYGLTEAFRATYLPPEELAQRPTSIGKAIPNAEVLVVRPDGTQCLPNEPGELVQRGALVALGYWNSPAATAERFRPSPNQASELSLPEIAVWSGDTVRKDEEGYLYFVERNDEMIKTSGYRVSPTEIEAVILASGDISEAVAFGVPHPKLGQAIVAVIISTASDSVAAALKICKEQLPNYMVPTHIESRPSLPRNANGKYDRTQLKQEFRALFTSP